MCRGQGGKRLFYRNLLKIFLHNVIIGHEKHRKTRKHKAVMQVSAIWSEAAGESVRKQKQWVAECLMTRAIQEEKNNEINHAWNR